MTKDDMVVLKLLSQNGIIFGPHSMALIQSKILLHPSKIAKESTNFF